MLDKVLRFTVDQLKRNAPAITLYGLNMVKKRMVYQTTLKDTSLIYDSFVKWLRKHHGDKFRNVQVEYSSNYDESSDLRREEHREESFIFMYKNHPIHLNKSIKEVEGSYNAREHGSYTLSTLFNKTILNTLLKDVFLTSTRKNTEEEWMLDVYMFRGHWKWYKEYTPIDIDNIILNVGNKEEIVDSINKWKADNKELKDRRLSTGLTHLYYGPPGTGKSSIIAAIGYKYRMDVYYLNLAGIGTMDELQEAFEGVPENSILLIEEIDQVYKGRKSVSKNTVKFEAFINFLSGVLVKSNIMIIMTTNDYDVLDPALIRAGRVDLKVEYYAPTLDMVNEYLSKFYYDDIKLSNDDVKYLPKSMALLESWCISNLHDIQGVFDKLNEKPCEEKENLNIKIKSSKNSGKKKKKVKSKTVKNSTSKSSNFLPQPNKPLNITKESKDE